MSSYMLGESWLPSYYFTRYMKESTYKHDFIPQKKGYDDYRPEGPYTDRPGYYNTYHDDYRFADRQYDRRNDQYRGSPDRQYGRRDDQYRGSPERQYDRRDDQYRGSPDRQYNRRDDQYRGSPERGYNSYPSGAQTDRPEYRRADNRDGGYNERGYQDMNRPFGINRTTQKDYGSMYERRGRPEYRNPGGRHISPERELMDLQQLELEKMERERPKPYRGQFHQEDDHIINKVRQRNMQPSYVAQHAMPSQIAPMNEITTKTSQRTGSGEVYLFIRARSDVYTRTDIKTSFSRHKGELQQEGGFILGRAPADMVFIHGESSNGWNIKNETKQNGVLWHQADEDIYCIKFSSNDAAVKWVAYNKDFKGAKFPEPNGVDLLIVPINYDPGSDLGSRTFVMTFYPRVINEGLKNHIEQQTKDVLESRWKCYPFVASTLRSKQLRGSWLIDEKHCLVSLHAFSTMDDGSSYEAYYREKVIGDQMRSYTRNGSHTTVMFTLQSYP